MLNVPIWSVPSWAQPRSGLSLQGVEGSPLTESEQLDHVTSDAPTTSSLQTFHFADHQNWPGIVFRNSKAWDWSKAHALTLAVTNATDRPVFLLLRVDDDVQATGDTHSFTGWIELTPQQHTTLLLPLSTEDTGLLAQPPGSDSAGRTLVGQVHGRIDLRHVVALRISGVRTDEPVTLRLGNPTLLPDSDWRTRYTNIADAYGQFVHGSWPEKVASDAALHEKLAAARAVIDQATLPGTVGRYGGLLAPGGLRASGFFHTERVAGRWWLVTPDGHAFFSVGVDAVTPNGRTLVAGREFMFTGLPGEADPLARFYGPSGRRDWFDIYQANLARGLGPDWCALWPGQTVARLRAWGFNTLGNWSDPQIESMHALPYMTSFSIGGAFAGVPMGSNAPLQDPFDTRFVAAADMAAAELAGRVRDDPWLIGVFSGNEFPWAGDGRPSGRLAGQILLLGADSPAKQALIAQLSSDYDTPTALAIAWKMVLPQSWDAALRERLAVPEGVAPDFAKDASKFEAAYADLYFRLVTEAWRRHDPNHMFLGNRFGHWSPEAVRACARWCDVLSFNIYARSPEQSLGAAIWHELDRPVLIGEFHFGSRDRGSFWPGVVDVGAEANRGPAYAAYLAKAAADPQIVGAHWFKYADEPLTGRPGDGENGHIGLVAITDIPFAAFTAAVAAANRLTLAGLGASSR